MVMITQRPRKVAQESILGPVRSDVAHALVGAVSALVPTFLCCLGSKKGRDESRPARKTACATSPGEDVVEMMLQVNDVIADEELQRHRAAFPMRHCA